MLPKPPAFGVSALPASGRGNPPGPLPVSGMRKLQFGLARMLGVPHLVAWYIRSQRARFARLAAPLSPEQKQAMAGFFLPSALESTRLVVLQDRRLQNPPLYWLPARLGFSDVPHPSNVTAMTFENVVVSHAAFSHGLLFHELVHVEQFRQLGVLRFSKLYVRGFLRGGGYHAIPLEANAYALGRRFESGQRFSVAEEVACSIHEERF